HPISPFFPYTTLFRSSYYLEGCAESGLDRPAVADRCFRIVAQHPVESRALALSTAGSLLKLGYAAVARDLLLPLEHDFRERADRSEEHTSELQSRSDL